mgnify:CR=1 FL=1|tara:strand:+ start:1099 stop:1866 length:768 start_codon:yes stop_codon:yes gene_type:complete
MNYFFLIISILFFNFSNAQSNLAFEAGEWLNYKISYSGWFKAGEVSVKLNDVGDLYHSKILGKSTGAINLFFKVNDRYESYFSKHTILPVKFLRNINEGGYSKNLEILFDQRNNNATVNDLKKKLSKDFPIISNSHDMVSVFYYLRNFFDIETLDENNELSIDMFFDSDNYRLKIKYLSTEILNTNFGKILSYKIKPYVQSGRVFKKDESLTMWVTADKNRIPLRIKADLVVGSIRIDLISFSNLKNPFEINFIK